MGLFGWDDAYACQCQVIRIWRMLLHLVDLNDPVVTEIPSLHLISLTYFSIL